jgi:hypothetical protein
MSSIDHGYAHALDLLEQVDQIHELMPPGRAHLKDPLDRAATSVVLNTAEGAGEFSKDGADRPRRSNRERRRLRQPAVRDEELICRARSPCRQPLRQSTGTPRPQRATRDGRNTAPEVGVVVGMIGARVSCSGLVLAILACASAAAPARGPARAARTTSVRDIDWLNRTYVVQWLPPAGQSGGGDPETYTLVDGGYADRKCQHAWIRQPVYGDLTGDGVEEVVIQISLKACDPLVYPVVQIYTSTQSTISLLGTVAVGEVSGKTNPVVSLAIARGRLLLTRLVKQPGDKFREASLAQHEVWRWDGHEFVEDVAARTTSPAPP